MKTYEFSAYHVATVKNGQGVRERQRGEIEIYNHSAARTYFYKISKAPGDLKAFKLWAADVFAGCGDRCRLEGKYPSYQIKSVS